MWDTLFDTWTELCPLSLAVLARPRVPISLSTSTLAVADVRLEEPVDSRGDGEPQNVSLPNHSIHSILTPIMLSVD